MDAPPLPLAGNVDCLAPLPGDQQLVLAGLSSFVGKDWTGGLALLSCSDAGLHQVASVDQLRAGVPSVAALNAADEFTGRRVVASGSDDGSLALWLVGGSEAPALERTQAAQLHGDAVLGLAAAPTGSQLASASADGTLRLWDCGQLLASTAQLGPSSGGPALHAVAWSAAQPGTLATGDAGGGVCLWDARQLGGAPAAAASLGAPVLSLALVSAAGGQELLAAGDALGRVTLLDPRSPAQPLQQARLHADGVHALAACGGRAASAGDDGGVRLLDPADLRASRQLAPATHEGQAPCYVRALAWQPAAEGAAAQPRLLRGGWDQAVAVVPL